MDMELSPDTLLRLAPGLRTRRDRGGTCRGRFERGDGHRHRAEGFGILARFSQPTRLGDAIDLLERDHSRSTDLAPTLSVVNMLIEEGALVTPDAGRALTSGWADPVEHARMLHDERRTGDYLAAIAAAVRPGDVVLDIGTGSGVFAVAAARAGAAACLRGRGQRHRGGRRSGCSRSMGSGSGDAPPGLVAGVGAPRAGRPSWSPR